MNNLRKELSIKNELPIFEKNYYQQLRNYANEQPLHFITLIRTVTLFFKYLHIKSKYTVSRVAMSSNTISLYRKP